MNRFVKCSSAVLGQVQPEEFSRGHAEPTTYTTMYGLGMNMNTETVIIFSDIVVHNTVPLTALPTLKVAYLVEVERGLDGSNDIAVTYTYCEQIEYHTYCACF